MAVPRNRREAAPARPAALAQPEPSSPGIERAGGGDPTEQRKLADGLRQREAIMARAQELAGMGHWTWTPQGADRS